MCKCGEVRESVNSSAVSPLCAFHPKLEDVVCVLRAGEASCLAQGDASDELIDTLLDQLQPLRSSTDGLSATPISQDGSPAALSCPNGAHTSANKNGTNYNGTSSVASYLNDSSSKRTDQNGSHLAQSSRNGASIKLTKHSQSVLTATHILVTAAEGEGEFIYVIT